MAIPYTKQTWADESGGGTLISASRLTVIEQGVYDAHTMPACRVFNSGAQTVNNTTWTTLTFDSETFDTMSGASSTQHDTGVSTSRLTCRAAGIYLITATNLSFAVVSSTGNRGAQIALNGAATGIAYNVMGAPITNGAVLDVTGMYALSLGDYAEVLAYQSSGGSTTVTGQAFMWVRVG